MRLAAAALAALLLPAVCVADFASDYERGVEELRRGRPAAAAVLLQRAAAQRPQPGDNVITYGTNRLARYHPYLALAEALLQLRRWDEAEQALQRSERYAKEPAAERAALQSRLAQARAAAAPPVTLATPAPPAPTAAPTALATATPAPVTTLPAATPPPAPLVHVTAPPPAPLPTPTPRAPEPTPFAEPPALPAEAVAPGSLAIVSDPPGAAVYLDDEPLGVTDPARGRLYKSGLPPGRHRVRLTHAERLDWSTEVDVPAGSLQTVRGTLSLAAPASMPVRPVLGLVVLLGTIAAFLVLRRRRAPVDARAAATVVLPDRPPTPPPTRPPQTPAVREIADTALLDRTPAPGQPFGAYALHEQLGRGGMASVHRAEKNGESCALKRPLGAFLDDPEFRERFLREAEIGRTLHHPNIIRIFDRGEVEGVPFFTMELVAGETLHALLKERGTFPPREAAQVVAQIAEALDYAHLKGVVHRDLKPSNIMVLKDGTVKVMDYGIARARRFEGLTVTGAFLGTPDYVAPETAAGRGSDGRSDLYALGIIFYELLTGKRPFHGETPFVTIQKQCTEPPTPPSLIAPGTPRRLETIVLRLLAKDPDERHPTAEDLLLELRDYLSG